MTLIELFILAVGLSMDAMAVAICKGLSVQKLKLRHAVTVGLYFGGFQAGMPLIGYFLGRSFQSYIEGIDHWIAFVLLGLIGANMMLVVIILPKKKKSGSFNGFPYVMFGDNWGGLEGVGINTCYICT